MKTYIVKEQAFNGSVTMGVQVYGVEAPDFAEAKRVLRRIIEGKGGEIKDETAERISYAFPMVHGQMTPHQLEILNA
jgi:hypothetical protein